MFPIRGVSLLVLAAGLALSGAALAEASGTVKKVSGEVHIERGEQRLAAAVGMPVLVKDRVVTGRDSNAGVTLKDDTMLAVGANSALTIDAFAFNATTQEGNVALRIVRGTLAAISGLIARRSPDALSLRAPTATIGIRGTEFIVEVPDGQ